MNLWNLNSGEFALEINSGKNNSGEFALGNYFWRIDLLKFNSGEFDLGG